MGDIATVSLARDGDAEIRASAIATTSYVGTKKVPSRSADSVEWSIGIDTIGSITQLDAVVEYSNLSDPNDDTKEVLDASASVQPEWIRVKDEAVSGGVVTQTDKNWRWTGLSTNKYRLGFTTEARGNWMRLMLKVNDGTGSLVSARVMTKK